MPHAFQSEYMRLYYIRKTTLVKSPPPCIWKKRESRKPDAKRGNYGAEKETRKIGTSAYRCTNRPPVSSESG